MEADQERLLPNARPIGEVEALLDIPVPIESWDVFDRLFAWELRPLDAEGQLGGSYMGAAVRSFFAQGGRKCYVVRVGDPWAYTADRADRIAEIGSLVPGFPSIITSSPVDRDSWHGVAHIFGLPDVSFLCMPDLVDAVRVEQVEVLLEDIEVPPIAEQFVECSDDEPVPEPDNSARLLRAPRCDAEGYEKWARAVNMAAGLIARYRREVHLIAAVPIPYTPLASVINSDGAEVELLELLTHRSDSPLANDLDEDMGISSAFVQLAYPWVRTLGSSELPESLESPDAVLTGILARNALVKGTYFSAARSHLGDVYDVYPIVRRNSMLRERLDSPGLGTSHSLLERVSLLGPTYDGLMLMSDVTTSLKESYRPASISRLIASILRTARRIGEDSVFENSGGRLWGRLVERMDNLLR